MYVAHLSLADFRSYATLEVALEPGVTAFVGPNGQGKTNLVEAVGYLATLGSHRVATDAPLVRLGAPSGPWCARRWCARARTQPDRARDEPGPGEPGAAQPASRSRGPARCSGCCAPCCSRRRTWPWSRATRPSAAGSSTSCWSRARRGSPACAPTTTGCSSSATPCCSRPRWRGGHGGRADLSTLDVWDDHLAQAGAELVAARLGAGRGAAPPCGQGLRRDRRRRRDPDRLPLDGRRRSPTGPPRGPDGTAPGGPRRGAR